MGGPSGAQEGRHDPGTDDLASDFIYRRSAYRDVDTEFEAKPLIS